MWLWPLAYIDLREDYTTSLMMCLLLIAFSNDDTMLPSDPVARYFCILNGREQWQEGNMTSLLLESFSGATGGPL